ncbi:MAG: caspase family protein [Nitrospira sp.]|nr:caspase family protein [Nitrospira sp.]
MSFAGGCEIDPKSIAFDNDPEKGVFQPNTEAILNFRYTAWGYGGKPYEYIVFELRRKITDSGELSAPSLFITRVKAQKAHGIARFSLPTPNSSFVLSYHEACLFTHKPLRSALHGGLVSSDGELKTILQFYESNYPGTKKLAEISSEGEIINPEIMTGDKIKPEIMTIYFKPGMKRLVDATIAAKKSPTFEWRKGTDSSPDVQDEEYAYRLDPLEDWSEYSTSKKVTYYFLVPGLYNFELRARYSIRGKRKETAIASIPMQVKEVISSPPPIKTLPKGEGLSPQFWEANRYQQSKALLIGVTQYDDQSFRPLPYVKKDMELVSGVFARHGFSIEKLENNTTKKRIKEAFQELLDHAMRGDRVIVYFSGHGTSLGASNFLVSTDCNSARKNETCIGYDWVKSWIDSLMVKKGVKHLLVVLDACHAGLGLYSKSSRPTPLEALAKYPGAHMMTAGLMEQNANIDTQVGVSIFTQKLVAGLEGQADLTKDKVITLSELLVYVQDKVSQYVFQNFNESQVPVMGKVKGAGEMLFRLP